MRVTISISCYNQEDKIANCIESVIAQDYNDIEILVVDDHSTDKSVEVIKNVFAVHPEVLTRLIVHDTNKGLSFVRNTGILEASGDAIFFVDGDDTMVENSLGLFCRKMKETNADVVFGSFRTIDEQGNHICEYNYPTAYLEGEFAFSMYIEDYLMNRRRVPIVMWNNLYRLDWLRCNDIHCSTTYKFSEGSFFNFQVALHANRVFVLNDVTYNWIRIPTSESHREITLSRLHALIDSFSAVLDLFVEFRNNHGNKSIPPGIFYYLHFICLKTSNIRNIVFSKISKTDKLFYFKTLKNKYRDSKIGWNDIIGIYNKLSYLILISPFPYILFKWFFRLLKTITKYPYLYILFKWFLGFRTRYKKS